MDWYTIIKRHFDAQRYDDADVGKFVIANKITEDQYQTITGQEYTVAP
jgi:uncharacterized XkdX family phage protein